MKRFQNILVSVDTRSDFHPALQWAEPLAEHNRARLKLIDVLPEFSWPVRLAMQDHDHVRDLLLQEKRERLAALAVPLHDKGIEVTSNAVCGKSSVEIIREVLRDRHDLVVRVSKGQSSRRSGFFGTTSFVLLRECPCPVWIVKPDAAPRFAHITAAVDPAVHDDEHIELNAAIVDLARSIAESENGRFSIVHAWSIYGEELLRSHMREDELGDLERRTREGVEKVFDQFLATQRLSIRDTNSHLFKGDASYVIPQFVEQNQVDLLVMGTVGRSGIAGLVMGNMAERILSRVECAVLALKPASFLSRVKLNDATKE